jgi:hypothetical protein
LFITQPELALSINVCVYVVIRFMTRSGAVLRGALGRFATHTQHMGSSNFKANGDGNRHGNGHGMDDDGAAVLPFGNIWTKRSDTTQLGVCVCVCVFAPHLMQVKNIHNNTYL